ncbi:MAG: PEP-CTERM sorting domain-containing protein [Pirellulales bacterium]
MFRTIFRNVISKLLWLPALRVLACLAALGGWGVVDGTRAAQVVYFALDDPRGTLANSTQAFNNFAATLGTYGTDTLESYANGAASPSLTFGASGITATTDTGFIAIVPPFAVTQSKVLVEKGPTSFGGEAFNDVFTFNQPITAFGFFASNIGDGFANEITFRLINTKLATSSDVLITKLPGGGSQNNVAFLGVTDTKAFDRVLIIESNDFDSLVTDDYTAGFVVPEPSTLVLLAAGGLALLWASGRRLVPGRKLGD